MFDRSKTVGLLRGRTPRRFVGAAVLLWGVCSGALAQTPTPSPAPTPLSAQCTGDCSSNGKVTVTDIVTMVDIALQTAQLSACPAGDANNDKLITIDEILTALNNALNGCGVTPTPTNTPQPPPPPPPTSTSTPPSPPTPTPADTPTETPTITPTPTPGCDLCALFGVNSCSASSTAR